jgi:hypothetical protein
MAGHLRVAVLLTGAGGKKKDGRRVSNLSEFL